jgi:methylthioribulose-1-phosphate dehydratase
MPLPFPASEKAFVTPLALRQGVADAARAMHACGWTPANSSNFSGRTAGSPSFAISVSGLDKGALTAQDFLEVDLQGQCLDSLQTKLKPSAETLLHAVIYQRFPEAQAVLHSHSVNGTVISKLYETQAGLWLKDFELLKAFEGIKTHDTRIWLPIFPNSQDMIGLSEVVAAQLPEIQPLYGFLLAGHGLYTWGETPAQALRHAEAFEFLFESILKLRSYGYADYS